MSRFRTTFFVLLLAAIGAYGMLMEKVEFTTLFDEYFRLENRLTRVTNIEPQLNILTENIWKAISAYDPKAGKKADFSDITQKDFFSRWDKELAGVMKETLNDNARAKLDIARRALKVLDKRVGSLKEESIKKLLEDDNASLFFSDTSSVAKDIYTDKMQKAMGQIRVSVGVIEKSVGDYVTAESSSLKEHNGFVRDNISLIESKLRYCLIGGLFILLLVFVSVFRIQSIRRG